MARTLREDRREAGVGAPGSTARLPKALGHWLTSNGLRLIHDDGVQCIAVSHRRDHVIGCVSPVRHFRILAHVGTIQVCDGHMDRWANSVGYEAPLPRTKAEFDTTLQTLLQEATRSSPSHEDIEALLAREASWAGESLVQATERLDDLSEQRRHGSRRRLRRQIRRVQVEVQAKRRAMRSARRSLAEHRKRKANP